MNCLGFQGDSDLFVKAGQILERVKKRSGESLKGRKRRSKRSKGKTSGGNVTPISQETLPGVLYAQGVTEVRGAGMKQKKVKSRGFKREREDSTKGRKATRGPSFRSLGKGGSRKHAHWAESCTRALGTKA